MRSGKLSIAAVLELADDDDIVAHTKVVDILKAQPRVGEVRATKVMERLRIAPNRRLRGLGPNQIEGLKQEFGADDA
jgi:ribosomal protein S13